MRRWCANVLFIKLSPATWAITVKVRCVSWKSKARILVWRPLPLRLSEFCPTVIRFLLFSPQCFSSALWASPSLHDAPSDTSCWHLDWTLMIPSSRVFMFDRDWEERAWRGGTTTLSGETSPGQKAQLSGLKNMQKYAKQYKKIHLSLKMKLQAQNLV